MTTSQSPIKFSRYPFRGTGNGIQWKEEKGKTGMAPELFLFLLKEPTTQTRRGCL